MVSSGARLGDHGDDMSRSMMGSQLERGNSSSTHAGGPRRTGALAASQPGGLETRDRSEAMQYDIAEGRAIMRARLSDTTICADYSCNQKSVHDRSVPHCFLPVASPNAASPTLSLKLDALSQTPRSPAVKYPLGQLIGSAVHLPCETHNLEAPRRSHTHASASSVHALRPPTPEQLPARPVSRRLTAAAATPQHRAATFSSPPSDCCSCAAIRTTSPAAFAGPW